jgi:hypothetical protein
MKVAEILKVNEPNVVHETIDGETILLDLNSGNYFSLDGPGAIIWEYIALSGHWKNTIALLTLDEANNNGEIKSLIQSFVEELVAENLLIENPTPDASADTTEIEAQLKEAAKDFVPPRLNKYSDMQDLLLLDPIHEVDEKGWPESKASEDDK